MVLNSVVLMYFAMPPQVGDHGEVAATTFNFACKSCHVLVRFLILFHVKDGESGHTFFASVAVHVSLQRAGTGEALIADLALVLLLRARRDFGAELAHHGLRRRGHRSSQKRARARQGPRVGEIDGLGGRAVIGDGAVAAVVAVGVVAGGRD